MANDEHLAIVKHGAEVWNEWRARPKARRFRPDLRGADLNGANLSGVNLTEADLRQAHLSRAQLVEANLREADLREADLKGAWLFSAKLVKANLSRADLTEAKLGMADLTDAKLSGANLREADFVKANLTETDLRGANLVGAYLDRASLIGTNLANATLEGCCIYGISAWDIKLDGAKQSNLVLTPRLEWPQIKVDDIEVAQFIYLLLHNQNIRRVIDTITSKAVLILGRFTVERKTILDTVREELRKYDYLPILFDFDSPASRDITETITLLARMARFIIADVTEPSSIPKELEAIVPTVAVPVQPLLEGSERPYSMFRDYWKYNWVLEVHRYTNLNDLLASLKERVIAPAEMKIKELEKRRREASP